mmetsp:Transcript_5008/g.5826  ORF Transcript_5008/g.5826 Transcript_5008/m.5826 type:complete len:153 (+) Transcript_5008:947-1405(+)
MSCCTCQNKIPRCTASTPKTNETANRQLIEKSAANASARLNPNVLCESGGNTANFDAMMAIRKDAKSLNKCAASESIAREEESIPPINSTMMNVRQRIEAIVRRRMISLFSLDFVEEVVWGLLLPRQCGDEAVVDLIGCVVYFCWLDYRFSV